MKPVYYTIAVLGALALGFLLGQPASAQPSNIEPPGDPTNLPSQTFSTAELKTFAVASLDVERINDQFQTKLQEAADPDEQVDLAGEAEERMMQAVEEKGLSVEKYNSIIRAARDDQILARQILDLRSRQSP